MQLTVDIQGFRLSPQQKRLWALQQTLGAAWVQGTLKIRGMLDSIRLERAVGAATAKHEAFRTLFCREPGVKVPLQVIVEESKPAWETVELHVEDAAAQSAKWKELLEEHRRQTIDWERGPLVRCALCRLSDREHWLLISLPAMCADARTLHNFADEIAAGYDAVEQHEPNDEPVQYAQFAEWQNELLAEEDAATGRQFWREVLAAPDPIILPFEQAREQTVGWQTENLIWDLDTEVVASLLALSKRLETPVEALILAAWQTVLCRVGGRREYLMALLSDGRKYDELESGMGLFAKWVPLRCRIDPNKTFQDLAKAVASDQNHVREWQEYFMWNGAPEGTGPATTELVGFEFETAKPLASLADVVFSFEPAAVRFEPLKLILSGMRRNQSIQLCLQADPRLVHAEALPILSEAMTALLTAAATQPEAAVGLLPLLGESRCRRLLQAGRGAMRAVSAVRSLQSLFENQAAERPDAIAVVCGDRCMTYAELNERANQIAHGLNRMGVGRGALVGLCVERSLEMVAGLLGVLKAGAAYVPLDPENSAARLTFEISQAGIAVILTQEKWRQRLPAAGTPVHCLGFHDWTFSEEAVDNPARSVHPMELAYVIYTSGSTGVPKGVAVTHLGVLNYTDFICRALEAEAGLHYATVSTLGADLGNTVIFASLASGGCLHVIEYDTATDGRKFGGYCAKHPIDVLKIVPAHFQALLATSDGADVLPRRLLVLGGDVLSHALADEVTTTSDRCRVLNHYGPTETTIGCLTFPIDAHREDAGLSATVPIGRAIDNAEAYVLDERLDPMPVGVPGELYLGGAGLARGYLGRPDLTAQRFVPHPFTSEPGSRLYKTGDLARVLPNGTVEFLGRTDFQIKLRGYRIELGEIEARLTEHPGIQQAVVAARANPAGEKYLAAYIVSRDSDGEPPGWREFLKERLPDYMVPTALVCLPALPLNQNGKVDRALLPNPEAYLASSRRYVAPRNSAEEMLTGIWETILKRDGIGIHDDFFDLGGHSLLATQVMARVRSVFRAELPLRTIFEATTVAELAEAIESARLQAGDMDVPPVSRVARDGPVPLSFAQQRLWVLTQLEPDGASYNLPIALRLSGTLDVAALERSVNALVRRHEVLRTTVSLSDGQPVQVVAPASAMSVPLVALDHLETSEREAAVLRLATAEAQRPFELAYGPMLRVTLLKLGLEEHVLLLTMHHIVSDAWSSHILVREMTELYAAQVQGRSASLPELPVQYADFSVWQRQWLSGARLDRQLDYWTKRLAGALEPLNLPMDHPRPPVQTSRGASVTLVLSSDLSSAITEFGRREGATPFMALLAGFYALLFRYTGRPDLVVGSPIANRTRSEIEGLIGFFVNTLALRADLSGNQTVRELLALVRQVCLDAYTHQDVPFEKLVEVLQPVRDVGYSPIFQVMFELQNAPTSELVVPGLRISTVDVEPLTAKFDLTLTLCETESGLAASMEYNTDLFSADRVMRMLRHYELILQDMAAQPDARIEELRLLTEEEHLLLADWNAGPRLSVPDHLFPRLFEAQVMATPGNVAAVWLDRRMTYQELNRRANRVAHALRLKGVKPETAVALVGDRDLDFLAMLLGIFKAGGMYLPLDAGHPDHRLVHMLGGSRPRVLLTAETYRERVKRLTEGFAENARPILLTMGEILFSVEQDFNPDTPWHAAEAAYVIYTSGSTGAPKGAIVEHRGMLNHLWGKVRTLELTAADVIAQTASQCFDISVWQFLAPLLCGGRVCIVPDEIAHDPARLLRHVEAAGVTVLETVPALLQGMLDMTDDTGEPELTRLRMVLPTGEALSGQLCRRWLARYPSIPLINAYGPAECADDVALHRIDRSPDGQVASMPVGRPVPNLELHVLSPSLKPLPVGVAGELCVAGAGVGRGYLRSPAKTAEVFVPHPFAKEPGARLYRTGDMAYYLPNGVTQFLGRMDHQVKVRGFRIELGEIESQLLEHPGVHEAVVVTKRDAGGDKRLVAYAAGRATGEALREFLRERLPDYMVPSVIVVLESLPRNANGKVDRRSLPEPAGRDPQRTFVAPRTDMESSFAREWAAVLGLPQVGIHDNFFDLGGHSLTAVQLVSRIQKMIGKPIALLDLFQAPTIASLAERITGQAGAAFSPFVVLQAGRGGAPLFCFDPTGTHVTAYQSLAYALGEDRPVYGLALSWVFSEPWNILSMDVIAARYTAIIRERQPEGPFHLLGWSNGGAIALAVARQLERQGESLAFLGILDTQPQAAAAAESMSTVGEELLHYMQGDRQEAFLALPDAERQALKVELERLGEEDRIEYAIQWAQDRKLLSREESDASVASLMVAYALDRETAKTLFAATQEPLRAPIHAWWTSATLNKHGKAPVDWTLYTREAAEIGTIVGEHTDVVQSIQVHQRISEILAMKRASGARKESYAVQP